MIVLMIDADIQPAISEYSEIKNEFSREEYIKIAKLNAILCLADAMDQYQQKFTNFTVRKRRI